MVYKPLDSLCFGAEKCGEGTVRPCLGGVGV